MAAKMKKPTEGIRKISKPIISSDIMGNRNVEVRAVGAWVQAEHSSADSEAVLAAQEEQHRIRLIQQKKQERLRQFQQEVKRRVKQLDRLKKQQNLENNYKASEHERNVVSQSAFSSEDIHNRKDSCLIRPMTALTIKQPVNIQDGYQSDPEDVKKQQAFSHQTNQIHQHVRHAKHNLVSRRVVTENFIPDNLPGGVWKISRTRDEEGTSSHPASRYTLDGDVLELEDEGYIYDNVKVVKEGRDDGYNKENIDDKAATKVVQFNLDLEKEKSGNDRIDQHTVTCTTTINGSEVHRNIPSLRVPNIYAGVQTEEEKRRARSQQATYRRLFMDLEREQVKENLRRQEHRKRIQKIKKEKEEERLKEEQISQQLIEPRDPVTGETSLETLEREAEERRFIRQTIREHERKMQKAKEMERYIEALRQQLKEKIRRKRIELPPLCCCGDTLWATNPETCANNCVFYKNPKEYARALQAMLNSNEFL